MNPIPPLLATNAGDFRHLRTIGEGSMGQVELVVKAGQEDKLLALKLPREGAFEARNRERLVAEAGFLRALRHPNLVAFEDAGLTHDGRPFLTMELVVGDDLSRFVARRAPDLRERLELAVQLCDAVGELHRNGIVHRDLKPANVLVSEQGSRREIKLLDLGLATVLDPHSGMVDSDMVVGTPQYLSPELVDHSLGRAGTWSDVYALGAMLYALVTDTPLIAEDELLQDGWAGLRRHICEAELEAPSERAERGRWQLRGDLDAIILKALARDPEQRYLTAVELAEELRNHLQGRAVSARQGGRLYHFSRSLKRQQSLQKVAAAAMLFATSIASLGDTRASQTADGLELPPSGSGPVTAAAPER